MPPRERVTQSREERRDGTPLFSGQRKSRLTFHGVDLCMQEVQEVFPQGRS